jgi:hypothetical protein
MPFVAIMAWNGEHRAFVIETDLKISDSIIATQRLFRRHFEVGRHGRVPDRKSYIVVGWKFQNRFSFKTEIVR